MCYLAIEIFPNLVSLLSRVPLPSQRLGRRDYCSMTHEVIRSALNPIVVNALSGVEISHLLFYF